MRRHVGEGILDEVWTKASVRKHESASWTGHLGSSKIIGDDLGCSGRIGDQLECFGNYLKSSGIMSDHLGTMFGIISHHQDARLAIFESSGIIWERLGWCLVGLS